ncbi:MAG TPA: Gfo/Idh/MocA family oxidoreductase [Blastocatellia bacterium]|nr:Gfo/Idh/MocA family oxidoreductase [Blastocatellia bacterium]
MIRAAVIGVGQFGREHARVYAQSADAELVSVCDTNEATGRRVAEQFGAAFCADYRDLIGKVDAVSLAAPTLAHAEIACALLEAGIHVLIEKPIARTLDEADAMIHAAQSSGAVLQVGHLERFNPAVMAAQQIVTAPRFFEAHRLSLFTPRSLDVDVVMDLMIHDIDVVLSLVGSPVREARAAGIPILTPRIDIANARIEFENGCVANLTASRVSLEKVRKVRFFQPHEYVSIDYAAQEAVTVSVKPDANGKMTFDARLLPVERGEPLRLEIAAFLAAIRGGEVRISGAEGRRALELALEIVARIREHAERAGVPFPA